MILPMMLTGNGGNRAQHEERIEGWEERTAGKTESSWFADAETLSLNKLDRDMTVDVVILGGGIAGMTTGYLLSKVGKKAAVLDDGNIGSGETGRTTAHITHTLDDRYFNIEKFLGKKGAQLAAESHTAAIDMIEQIVVNEKIDCDFERLDGFLFLDPSDSLKSLNLELDSAHRAGISNAEIIDRAPLRSFDTGPCIRFPNQAQFQPLKYMAGLARAMVRGGSFVFTGTHGQSVTGRGVKTTEGYTVKARKIVVATNAPIVDKISKIYDKQIAYRTYVIAARIKKGDIRKALYWDTGDQQTENLVNPYHYVRIQELSEDHDLLIVGGEDHETGYADDIEDRYGRLELWAKKRFPIEEIEYRWSGQVLEPKDMMAFIGRNPRDKRRNIFIATGDSGNGMTHGTIAGMLLTDLIIGKRNRWAGLYNPSRKTRGKPKKSSGEGQEEHPRKIEMAEAAKKAEHLKSGQGIVLEIKRKGKRAFYKDTNGKTHSLSAVCTHGMHCELE